MQILIILNFLTVFVAAVVSRIKHPVMWGKFDGNMPIIIW